MQVKDLVLQRLLKEGAKYYYENKTYLVHPNGEVYDILMKRFLEPVPTEVGLRMIYRNSNLKIDSTKKRKTKNKMLHTMMAETFIMNGKPVPSNKQVRFLDEDFKNKQLSNMVLINSYEKVKEKKRTHNKTFNSDADISWMGSGDTIYA